jgi:hypothetical protein
VCLLTRSLACGGVDVQAALRLISAAMPRDAELSGFATGLDSLNLPSTPRGQTLTRGRSTMLQLSVNFKRTARSTSCEMHAKRRSAITPALRSAAEQAWDALQPAAERALETNASTISLANVAELLRPDGILASFRAHRYVVDGP